MREAIKRCDHCAMRYVYLLSGFDPSAHKDGKYCPPCSAAVQAALAVIPRRFEKYRTNVGNLPRFAGVTVEQVRQWETDEGSRAAAGNVLGVPLYRVHSPLFKIDRETSQVTDAQKIRDVKGRDAFQGVTFILCEWQNGSGPAEVQLEAEFDLVEQKFTGRLWGEV